MGFLLKLNTLRPKKKVKDFFDFFNGRNANIRKTQGHKEKFYKKMSKICSRAGKGAGGGALSPLSPLSPHPKSSILIIYMYARMSRVFMKIVAMQS